VADKPDNKTAWQRVYNQTDSGSPSTRPTKRPTGRSRKARLATRPDDKGGAWPEWPAADRGQPTRSQKWQIVADTADVEALWKSVAGEADSGLPPTRPTKRRNSRSRPARLATRPNDNGGTPEYRCPPSTRIRGRTWQTRPTKRPCGTWWTAIPTAGRRQQGQPKCQMADRCLQGQRRR
jgi:hypothetical protein